MSLLSISCLLSPFLFYFVLFPSFHFLLDLVLLFPLIPFLFNLCNSSFKKCYSFLFLHQFFYLSPSFPPLLLITSFLCFYFSLSSRILPESSLDTFLCISPSSFSLFLLTFTSLLFLVSPFSSSIHTSSP